MPDYSAGRIYKLVSDASDEVYVGSTTQALSQRLAGHRRDAKKNPLPCHAHFAEVGWDTVHIVLLEDCPCERREQLLARERYWMEQIGTLNRMRPIVTKEEAREEKSKYDRAHYVAHRKERKACVREYAAAHREEIAARNRKYREAHREAHREYNRAYMREYRAKKRVAAAEPPATPDAAA